MPAVRRAVIEADGGSRGNPGPAAYGVVLRDADTGEVIDERAEPIGTATNNVAEYRGLIAGLELAARHAPDAELEVRLDSKLVVEQMAGRWKIKHPDLRPLAIEAQRLAPVQVEWTWIPREQNTYADRLLNVALDAAQGTVERTQAATTAAGVDGAESAVTVDKAARAATSTNPMVGWNAALGQPTTLVLLRHGATDHSVAKRFSGSGGDNPGLNRLGREQARAAASWLRGRGGIDAVVASPLRRTHETATIVATELGLEADTERGLRETDFGAWDGHTFAEVRERWRADLEKWLDSTSVAPPGGESFETVARRVRRIQDKLLSAYAGQTVVVVSHVTPIKLLVRAALDAPLEAIYKMELSAGSITQVAWFAEGHSSLRCFNLQPE